MSFLPSGTDTSDTCWRHSHLHESYTYYIVPTCRLPRETSSLVGGSNSKLLLPVTWHRVAVIIYVRKTVVSRPRGHLVHLWQFQLYDARRVEALLKPSDANLTMCRDNLLPIKNIPTDWSRGGGTLVPLVSVFPLCPSACSRSGRRGDADMTSGKANMSEPAGV